ncbi:MAG TPA: TlpA disulfide reductase family protein [Conexibacter sp.]|nr:TlpA disulfide reductase family protein [Conexibacter sp.]
MSGRPTWIAIAAGLAVLAYITYNTLSTPAGSSTGLAAGARMPPFAAPLVASDLVGDANVATRPDQGAAGARPACGVTDPRALNSCALARRGPVVLAFFAQDAGRCLATLDTLRRLAARHPDVGVAAVGIRGDRGTLRALVRRHGWRFPVAQDRDGAVANLYGVAVCPTVVLAHRGGVVLRTALGSGETTAAKLERDVRELERGSGAAR